MNRFFIEGEGIRDFPHRSYAKIDNVEPANINEVNEVVVSLDAVDADWNGFEKDPLFSLKPEGDLETKLSKYWGGRFNDNDDNFDLNAYDRVPIFNIEITARRGDELFNRLTDTENGWLEVTLAEDGVNQVDVYGGLFDAPITAYLDDLPKKAPFSYELGLLFDMSTWPDATVDEIQGVLRYANRCSIDQLGVMDIGQGSANAIICKCGFPSFYYDVGCGVYRNARTTPTPLNFCTCFAKVVILSHWDSDHWAGATKDTSLQKLEWIAPRQSIGPRHTAFVSSLLAMGGKLHIFPAVLSPQKTGTTRVVEIRKCTGTFNDRNGSGLVIVISNTIDHRSWLLTGDAPYNKIPGTIPTDLSAVVIPHHGADMGASSIPPLPALTGYQRLLYSFGPDNKHGRTAVTHPTMAAMNKHETKSWKHGSWLPTSPGLSLAGRDILATATNSTSSLMTGAHLGGAAAGWLGPPSPPAHLLTCPSGMKFPQT